MADRIWGWSLRGIAYMIALVVIIKAIVEAANQSPPP